MKPSSTTRPRIRQTGYALLLMVVALMGIGGVVMTGFTQGAKQETEHQRYLHNQRVLREAKQALLQYAYNYPVTNGFGPGRLPNADTDNDGISDGGSTFGRLPWAQPNLNLYDIRDAAGQSLWYAVSSTFRPQAAAINSDTSGTITLRDQAGNVIFDGSNPAGLTQYGVAAVIIAPGPPIARDGVLQDRPADENEPLYFLDKVAGIEDNSGFTNGDNTDGLILGPVNNLTNDQFIVITAAEVIAMAEKATLQAYRDSINNYLNQTGNVYPWLYNYDGVVYNPLGETIDVAIDKLSDYFPAGNNFSTEQTDYLGNIGRVPSMFAPYFRDAVDSEPIESKLSIEILNADFMGSIIYNRTFPSASSGTYTFVNTIWNGSPTADGPANMNDSIETVEPLVDVRFEDDAAAGVVKLIGSIAADETYPIGNTIWFWSRNDLGVTEWAKCKSVHLEDCHVDASYIPDPHGAGQQSIQILKVDVEFTADSSVADAIEIALNVNNLAGAPANPVIAAADSNGHAQITATFDSNDVVASDSVIKIHYEWDDNYTDGNYDVDESGTLDFSTMAGASLRLGLRFYPEIPHWAFANGWHNSVRMAYADNYAPDTLTVPCDNTNCLRLPDTGGDPRDKISLLVLAGQHNWLDTDLDGELKDELRTVFDNGNYNNNETFYRHRGNDKILVIDEL